MKSLFEEFYFDNKNTDIWTNSVIVLDTNILLNLYRYSKETSEKLLALLEKSKDRLWLPHQIALEFHLNRTNVILDQQTSYEKIKSILRKKSSEIEASLNKELGSYRKKHVTLSIDSIIEQIKSSIDSLAFAISKEQEEHPILLKNDHIKQQITTLFENKVGKPYIKKELEEIAKEADKRYSLEIPPGYRDASKKGAKFHNGEMILEKYGDYILWRQIIDYAIEKPNNIIFITDDEKKDWWYESKGKTIGPRSELLNEFKYKTNMEFYMFNSDVFMKEAGAIYSESFSDNSITEVKEVRSHYFNFEQNDKELTQIYLSFQTRNLIHQEDVFDALDRFFHGRLGTLDIKKFTVIKGILVAEMFLNVLDSFDSEGRLAINEELEDHFDVYDVEFLEFKVVFLN
ncbi:PIN-like domain-containing protein [Bacillus safensis]|nr:PIN domain-containing protein [Bacillus safensis]MCM2984318.1 PIN domain-containing protein [Bacillus safensis]MCY7446055.1 PIN domain-containing protein [Bacillus safensis]MCY7458103.1 PIN domain-containing protein [Bacillus safensis]MEC0922748.1 PIN domain-containing protein [Bacillus safensis]MEC0995829.1 PIN domain-containing protein [Bacillus safensis]